MPLYLKYFQNIRLLWVCICRPMKQLGMLYILQTARPFRNLPPQFSVDNFSLTSGDEEIHCLEKRQNLVDIYLHRAMSYLQKGCVLTIGVTTRDASQALFWLGKVWDLSKIDVTVFEEGISNVQKSPLKILNDMLYLPSQNSSLGFPNPFA